MSLSLALSLSLSPSLSLSLYHVSHSLPLCLSLRALADMGKDGKMDRLEFSIAMKLIKLQLQGQPLPPSLPIIMKQTPAPVMTSSTRFGKPCVRSVCVCYVSFKWFGSFEQLVLPEYYSIQKRKRKTSSRRLEDNFHPC